MNAPGSSDADNLLLEQFLREMVQAMAHRGGIVAVGIDAPDMGHPF
jgi:hypothetical protein